jgi:transketolase
VTNRPVMIITQTIKGKGVSITEDRDGRHDIALSETDLQRALDELDPMDDQRGWTYLLS